MFCISNTLTSKAGGYHKHQLEVSLDGKYRACTIPGCRYRITTDRTVIVVTKDVRRKLQALKKELGFRNLPALFAFLILEETRGTVVPPASYDLVFRDTRPVILTGESGAGKTTTIHNLVGQYQGNAFVLDVSNEYAKWYYCAKGDAGPWSLRQKDEAYVHQKNLGSDHSIIERTEFERLDLGRLFSLKWTRPNQRACFVTNPNPDISKVEAATIFPRLAFEMHAGNLKDWLLVIEEGHRFSQDPGLRALLIEARKFTRKLLLVTTDWRLYEGIAKVFKPRPWESEITTSQTPA